MPALSVFQFEDIVESAPDGIVTVDTEGAIVYVNAAAERMFGYDRGELLGRGVEILVPEAAREAHAGHRRRFLAGGQARGMGTGPGIRARHRDGREFPADIALGYRRHGGGVRVTAFVRDVTARERTETLLRASERRYRALYDDNPTMYMTLDAEGRIVSVNRFGAGQLGGAPETLEGTRLATLAVGEDDAARLVAFVEECRARADDVVHGPEAAVRGAGGTPLWVRATGRMDCAPDGRPLVHVVCSDITQERALAQRLEHLATHDALTGLVNRRELERRLARLMQHAREEGTGHALCYLDLDQFKAVNDTCGHLAGDELLRQVSGLLVHGVRGRDTVARLGGDEFAVLLEHCDQPRALAVAEKLRGLIAGHRFAWEGRVFGFGASIGLVPVGGEVDSVTEILRRADSACYVAKASGRDRVCVYEQSDADLARWHGDLGWLERIQHALDDDRFVLHAQRVAPCGPTGTDGAGHYEILVRMLDADGTLIAPGAFLPAAERFDHAARIDRWVTARALRWLREHCLAGGAARLFINLSARSLDDGELLALIRAALADGVLAPGAVCFEITESAAMANLARALGFMEALRSEGCRFALDDFGKGLSSFAYLRDLPVDYVKIDGGFVRDLAGDPVHAAMVRSINEVAHVMGKRTIAECVESPESLRLLADIGIDYVQGWHIGPPQPLESIGAD